MPWWNVVFRSLNIGDTLFTPGRGLDGGNRRRPFTIISIESSSITIKSGKSSIRIEKECFDAIEDSFRENLEVKLRVASLHTNEPFPNSADELIRNATGSSLARGNYVCSILERCNLVRYSMLGNKKVIVL